MRGGAIYVGKSFEVHQKTQDPMRVTRDNDGTIQGHVELEVKVSIPIATVQAAVDECLLLSTRTDRDRAAFCCPGGKVEVQRLPGEYQMNCKVNEADYLSSTEDRTFTVFGYVENEIETEKTLLVRKQVPDSGNKFHVSEGVYFTFEFEQRVFLETGTVEPAYAAIVAHSNEETYALSQDPANTIGGDVTSDPCTVNTITLCATAQSCEWNSNTDQCISKIPTSTLTVTDTAPVAPC
jgi:hypothetical protein